MSPDGRHAAIRGKGAGLWCGTRGHLWSCWSWLACTSDLAAGRRGRRARALRPHWRASRCAGGGVLVELPWRRHGGCWRGLGRCSPGCIRGGAGCTDGRCAARAGRFCCALWPCLCAIALPRAHSLPARNHCRSAARDLLLRAHLLLLLPGIVRGRRGRHIPGRPSKFESLFAPRRLRRAPGGTARTHGVHRARPHQPHPVQHQPRQPCLVRKIAPPVRTLTHRAPDVQAHREAAAVEAIQGLLPPCLPPRGRRRYAVSHLPPGPQYDSIR